MLNNIVIPQAASAHAQLVTVHPMQSMRARSATISLERVEEFLAAYTKCVEKGEAHIAERPTEITPILVDVDLSLSTPSGPAELYTLQEACTVAAGFARAARDLFEISAKDMQFVLLIKPARSAGGKWKHGFHMHALNAAVRSSESKNLCARAKTVLKDFNFASGLNAFTAIDDMTNKPWLMYGSTKSPGTPAYKASKIIKVSLEELTTTVSDYPKEPMIDTVRKLLITIPPAPTAQKSLLLKLREGMAETFAPIRTAAFASAAMEVEDDGMEVDDEENFDMSDDPAVVEALRTLVTVYLSGGRAESYNEWISVAFIIAGIVRDGLITETTGLELFKVFSKRSAKYCAESCEVKWRDAMARPLQRNVVSSAAKLCRLAQKDNQTTCANTGTECDDGAVLLLRQIILNKRQIKVDTEQRLATCPSEATKLYDEIKAGSEDSDMSARQLFGVKCLEMSILLLKPKRLEDVKVVRTIYRALACERTLGNIEEEEFKKLVDLLMSRASKVANLIKRDDKAAVRYENRIINRGKDLTIVTPGVLFGYAAADGGQQIAEFIERNIVASIGNKAVNSAGTYIDMPQVYSRMSQWWRRPLCSIGQGKSIEWFEFDGTAWSKSPEFGFELSRHAVMWAYESLHFNIIKTKMPSRLDDDALEELINEECVGDKRWTKLFSELRNPRATERLAEVFSIFSRMPTTHRGGFDSFNTLIAFNNAVYDSNTNEVRGGSQNDYISRKLSADYVAPEDLNADHVAFVEDFMAKIHPDEAKREYFLNSCSNMFSGNNPWKQYMIWTGTGHNGKSVCVNLFEKMFDKLLWKLNKSVLLMGKYGAGGGPTPDMVRLAGARCAITDEIGPGEVLNSGTIKLLSGNDSFTCRDLYKGANDIVTVSPAFIPIIVLNDLPALYNPDAATWGRLRVFEFESTFTSDVAGTHDKISKGMLKANPDYVFKGDSDYPKKLLAPEIVSTFASMLLHRYRKMVQDKSSTELSVPPNCVRQGEVMYVMSQNSVYQALSKHFLIRKPYSKRQGGAKDDDKYRDVVGLDEIAKLVNSNKRTQGKEISAIIEDAGILAEYFKPDLEWDSDAKTLTGVQRIESTTGHSHGGPPTMSYVSEPMG